MVLFYYFCYYFSYFSSVGFSVILSWRFSLIFILIYVECKSFKIFFAVALRILCHVWLKYWRLKIGHDCCTYICIWQPFVTELTVMFRPSVAVPSTDRLTNKSLLRNSTHTHTKTKTKMNSTFDSSSDSPQGTCPGLICPRLFVWYQRKYVQSLDIGVILMSIVVSGHWCYYHVHRTHALCIARLNNSSWCMVLCFV